MKKISVGMKRKANNLGNNSDLSGGGIKISSAKSTGSFGHFGSKVVVKNRFIRTNLKQVKNHIKYIENRQEGEKAELFNKEKDQVHRYSYFDQINPHIYQIHHKIVISPEDRLNPDQLKELAREMMLKLENHKQQEIVWIAAIHNQEGHTKYPHLHIIASGKDASLRIEKEDLDLIRKEASRYVSRETSMEKAIQEKIKEEYKKEIAIIDVKPLDKDKAEDLAKIHQQEKIKELSGHIIIKPLDQFNDRKLKKIGSQLFLAKDKESYLWVKDGTINILIKDTGLIKSELLALKSELTAKIRETKTSLFSDFKDHKTIPLKDEVLEQEVIKYARLKEERKVLHSQNHTDQDKILRNKVAIESNFHQIKEQLRNIKERYNSLNGINDKTLHQLIKSGKDIELTETIIRNFAKKEQEYAKRNIEYAGYEKYSKRDLILKTYFSVKEKSIDKAIADTIKTYKNITGQGEKKFILDAPLSSDLSRKLASIDMEKSFRETLKMKTEGHFENIRKTVLAIPSPEKKHIIPDIIEKYLQENKIILSPQIKNELIKENIAITRINEIKDGKFLQEEKPLHSGYFLTLNEAIITLRRAEKITPEKLGKLEESASKRIDKFYFKENQKFREEKLMALKDFFHASMDTKTEKNTPPIIENRAIPRIKNQEKSDQNKNLDELDSQILKFYKYDPIRIIEHISDQKMFSKKELSEYVHGIRYLKTRDELSAEIKIITEKAIEKRQTEERIKEDIATHYAKRLKELGIEKTNLSTDNLQKSLSNIKEKIMEHEINNASFAPFKNHQKRIGMDIER